MNTPPIFSAQPPAANASTRNSSGSNSEAESNSPSFSKVLSDQTPAAPSPAGSAAPVKSPSAPTLDEKNQTADEGKVSAGTDDELAEAAAELGLSLPQIALNIAAEVTAVRQAADPDRLAKLEGLRTAALARQQSAMPKMEPGEDTPDATLRFAPATTSGEAQTAERSIAAANTGSMARTPALPSAALPSMQATIVAGDTRSAVGTTAPNTPSTRLAQLNNQGKAINIAGAKQAVLTMQARGQAAQAATEPSATANFLAALSGAASITQPGVESSVSLTAAQAGAISAANGIAGGASLLPGAAPALSNTGAPASLPGIATPLHSPNWAGDFGRQFVSMTQGGQNMPHTAELRLDPPELGPLRISINITDNVASAVFVSPHANVRQTVENALPHLQQLLAQAGISLGQTSVNDQGQPQQAFNESFGNSQRNGHSGAAAGHNGDNAGSSVASSVRSPAPDALVDTFA